MWTTKSSARRRTGLAAAAVVVAGGAVAGGVAVAQAASPSAAGTTATPTASATTGAAAPSGAPTGTGTGTTKDSTKHKALRAGAIARLKGVQHATWVTEGKDGAFVTHDAIRGAVTAISPTSITVKAKDGLSQTYTVTKDTKISLAQGHGTKPTSGATTDVTSGADVVVSGTGTGTALTAERVVVPKG